MQIAKDTVVSLDYQVEDAQGVMVDEGKAPLVYLHGGYGGIFERIEAALEGKASGDALVITLEPGDAFGEYDADLVSVEPRNQFPETIEVGMQFERTDSEVDEYRLLTITDIADDAVVVDGNHPLAGMTLVFSATVAEVRTATADEVAHGHVHGEDGHGHH